jgi:hypothetical protein
MQQERCVRRNLGCHESALDRHQAGVGRAGGRSPFPSANTPVRRPPNARDTRGAIEGCCYAWRRASPSAAAVGSAVAIRVRAGGGDARRPRCRQSVSGWDRWCSSATLMPWCRLDVSPSAACSASGRTMRGDERALRVAGRRFFWLRHCATAGCRGCRGSKVYVRVLACGVGGVLLFQEIS